MANKLADVQDEVLRVDAVDLSCTARGKVGFVVNVIPGVSIITEAATLIILELMLRMGETMNVVAGIVMDTTPAGGIDVSVGTEGNIGAAKETELEFIPMPAS